MQKVKIKGVGDSAFPDDMPIDDIRNFLRAKYSQRVVNGQSDILSPKSDVAAPYEPTLAEKMGQGVSDALVNTGLVSNRYGAQQVGGTISALGEMLPGVGDATAGDEFGRAVAQGDNVGMGLGLLGAVPIVGDLAKKFKGKGYHQTDKIFDDFDFDKTSDGTVWFTGDKANFADPESSAGAAAGKGRIIERDIELNKVAGYDELDKYSVDELVQQGYDGAVLDGDIQVFDPKAIQKQHVSGIINNTNQKESLDEQITEQARAIELQRQSGFRGGFGVLDESSGKNTTISRQENGNLDGLPVNIKGFTPAFNPKIAGTAQRYMESIGQKYSPPNKYIEVDEGRSASIADLYDKMEHNPKDKKVLSSYNKMIDETIEQYKIALEDGLKVEFIDFDKMGDPYNGSPRLATEDIIKNNHMYVFSTRDGFGSNDSFDPVDNPLLKATDFEISGQKALANDIFRVVHDYFGHAKEGVGFRASGEENAWRNHAPMYSPEARRALASETRGQNSWLNYGKFGAKNRNAKVEDTVFADQKIGLLPEWVSEGYKDF